MAFKKSHPAPAVPAQPVATPLVDEVEGIGQRVMTKVEEHIEQMLEKNLSWTITKLIALLHTIGKLTIGEEDQDVQRLHQLLMQNGNLLQEIIDNQPALKKRFAETIQKEHPCPACHKALVCHTCGHKVLQ